MSLWLSRGLILLVYRVVVHKSRGEVVRVTLCPKNRFVGCLTCSGLVGILWLPRYLWLVSVLATLQLLRSTEYAIIGKNALELGVARSSVPTTAILASDLASSLLTCISPSSSHLCISLFILECLQDSLDSVALRQSDLSLSDVLSASREIPHTLSWVESWPRPPKSDSESVARSSTDPRSWRLASLAREFDFGHDGIKILVLLAHQTQ